MNEQVSFERYSRVAVFLHWVMAALILVNLILAVVSANSEGGAHRVVLNLHKSIGFSVLLLSLARLAWRLYRPPPPMLAGKAAWERPVAGIVHTAFYFMMVLIPFLGWWVSSAAPKRHAINVLGWEAPFLPVMQGKAFAGAAMAGHKVLGFTMAALLVLHIGAALKHHFIDRDKVLSRMTFPPLRPRA